MPRVNPIRWDTESLSSQLAGAIGVVAGVFGWLTYGRRYYLWPPSLLLAILGVWALILAVAPCSELSEAHLTEPSS